MYCIFLFADSRVARSDRLDRLSYSVRPGYCKGLLKLQLDALPPVSEGSRML